MKKKAILIFGVLIFLIGNVRADCVEGITAGNNISQYGITWFFDKPYQCGTFVNGDYWVKTDDSTGVVNVIRITPDFQQFNFNSYLKWINGWEVNPTYSNKHGFDERAQLYDAILVPSLPYNAHADESLIKADSWEEKDEEQFKQKYETGGKTYIGETSARPKTSKEINEARRESFTKQQTGDIYDKSGKIIPGKAFKEFGKDLIKETLKGMALGAAVGTVIPGAGTMVGGAFGVNPRLDRIERNDVARIQAGNLLMD